MVETSLLMMGNELVCQTRASQSCSLQQFRLTIRPAFFGSAFLSFSRRHSGVSAALMKSTATTITNELRSVRACLHLSDVRDWPLMKRAWSDQSLGGRWWQSAEAVVTTSIVEDAALIIIWANWSSSRSGSQPGKVIEAERRNTDDYRLTLLRPTGR